MCGIVGFVDPDFSASQFSDTIEPMLETIAHRGPDEFGYYLCDSAGLGNARLSIIDLSTGSQPMCDETGRFWIVYNGEVYNYLELKEELERAGVKFRTQSDTEVVLYAWIHWGTRGLSRLNGGYAFAIYDSRENELILVRDRFGKRPLYYAQSGNGLLFASEMKAFAACPGFSFGWDVEKLQTLFTLWTPLPAETCWQGIKQVLPAACLRFRNGAIREEEYWRMNWRPEPFAGTLSQAQETVRELLTDSVRIRLRSDVEVGTYLSGGLDSSITTQLATAGGSTRIHSFSVCFEDQEFDEKSYQEEVSRYLGTDHHALRIGYNDIAENFPQAVWHVEVPVFRTAFVPMYLLSRSVREHGIKVVLTGEGSDEAFLGYDIFKEAHLLSHWHELDDAARLELLGKMYPYMRHFTPQNARALSAVYDQYSSYKESPAFSHAMRFNNSSLALKLLKPQGTNTSETEASGTAQAVAKLVAFLFDPLFRDPQCSSADNGHAFSALDSVTRAQAIEFATLLAGYLLSSQGDRASLAHGVENRCPFLDYRLVEFAATLPADWRLENGLHEKQILKQTFKDSLPQRITQRPKQPYRAPDAVAFLGSNRADYMELVLSQDALEKTGIVDTATAQRLVNKLRQSRPESISPRENQAFLLLLSTAVLHEQYVECRRPSLKNQRRPETFLKVDRRSKLAAVDS